MPIRSPLTNANLCIVFAYAPAGLGHLRVTDALRHGLPEETQPILLPQNSESIKVIHTLTSRNPFGKRLMEWAQKGIAEMIVTRVYRWMLRRDAKNLEEEIIKVLKQRVELPQTLLVVATHFGLAHQISKIKKTLEKKANVKVLLVMQVTDDSPQKIWYVPNADMIAVPSDYTKRVLLAYSKAEKLESSSIRVLPYPISTRLSEKLLLAAKKHRRNQLNPDSSNSMNVIVPISGAAVGTIFADALIRELYKKNKRFFFHIVSKRGLYTDLFLQKLERKPYIETFSSHSDRQIVELYEQAYERTVLSMEVTKPSEQAFKALFSPDQNGGVILLFSSPVGRQEHDNIEYLKRHQLIPSDYEQQTLHGWAEKKWKLTDAERRQVQGLAKNWRGLRLPTDPILAASFIDWCHTQQILSWMGEAEPCSRGDSYCQKEVSSNGVKLFWTEVEKLL